MTVHTIKYNEGGFVSFIFEDLVAISAAPNSLDILPKGSHEFIRIGGKTDSYEIERLRKAWGKYTGEYI